MQEIIEDAVRGIGYVVLKAVTFGTYRSGRDGLLAEGAIGLLVVAAVMYVTYRIAGG
jgi:inner membrane protein involved in colicin E2 resistance